MHLENSMVMYGLYNAETLEILKIQYIACIIPLQKLKDYLQDN